MQKAAVTFLFYFGGFVVGLALLVGASWEAAGGRGSYTLWGIAGLPGLVLGIGTRWSLLTMFVLPVLQWPVVGLCLGKVIAEKRPAWSLGTLAIAAAYILAALLGRARLHATLVNATADRAAWAGLGFGIVLAVGTLAAVMLSARGSRLRARA
jgi:hypothetical protein